MRIWVDLVNSPQVLVLQPVIRELECRGHEVLITTRDFAQTVQLADRAGLQHRPFGAHGGSSRARAIRVNLERVAALLRYLRGQRIDLALSHNSYSQAIAARLRGIPFVTMMDYEHHRANHIAFRLAKRVLVPSVFPEAALQAFGAAAKTVRYAGLKEEIYLSQFAPDPEFLPNLAIPSDHVVVVARPPGLWADYYQGQGDLFSAFVDHVLADPASFVVFLPRTKDQVKMVERVAPDRLLVPERAVDGPNLLYYADLAFSAGGTMNREAAVLGTPVCTVFEGQLGAVDRMLVEKQRLRLIENLGDVSKVKIEKKPATESLATSGTLLLQSVTDAILEAI